MEKKDEKKTANDIDLISENELYEIFDFQYDDLFCKILKISEKSFTYFLKQQVLFNLQIIKKTIDQEILSAYQDLFIKRYKENIKSMKNDFSILKEKEENNDTDITYLDISKCYIHCHKCFNIIHKCGKKLILYNEHIFCIKCNNVYNKNQIMLFCPECQKNYISKLRKPVYNENNKKFEKLFLLKFKKYHCDTNKEEKIKCLKCSNNLYYRLSSQNLINDKNINKVYCIKCKLKYNLNEVFFKCKKCLKNFKSEAKLFRDFPKNKKHLLFLIHTLLRNKSAQPSLSQCEQNCDCDLKEVEDYFHSKDKGKLLEGLKNNQKYIVCEKCFFNIKYDEADWKCPKCGENIRYIKSKKIDNNNNFYALDENDDMDESRKIPVFKVNTRKNISKEKIIEKNLDTKTENGAKTNEIKKDNNINIRIIRDRKIKKNHFFNTNLNNNKEKIKTILFNKGESNEIYLKGKFELRKSRSKNDVMRNKKKNDTKIINSRNKEKDLLIKNNNSKLSKIPNSSIISNDKNDEKINIKTQSNIKDTNLNEIPKPPKNKESKDIDTAKIFNKILDNIYNYDEPYNDSSNQKNDYKKENDIKIRYSYRQGKPKEEVNQIKPKYKKSYIFENRINNEVNPFKNEFNSGIINEMNYIGNKEINQNLMYNDNNIIYDNIDENRNLIYKKNQENNIFKRSTKNIYYENINNQNIYNNEENNLYANSMNASDFQNYDNYYINYQECQAFNLYNFNSNDYSKIKLLGKGAIGKIYLVNDLQSNQKFALKTMLIDNEIQIKSLDEQYNLMYRLTYENPGLKIVNIFGLEINKIDKFNIFFNILMEAAISDWEVEIINRKKINKYYTEQELYYILTNLLDTLSFLQQKGISHRDLKPQNILYFGNNEYKICDFGEAKYKENNYNKKGNQKMNNFDDSKQTIRGTEMYMSPILFKAMKFRPNSLTSYNSFKSDVYSLGLCFLNASCLDENILYKIREITDMEIISNIVNKYLGMRYSQNFINLLLNMLQTDENYRPDFIELNSWIIYGNY